MSYFSALRFIKHADEVIREGCEKYKDRAFKVPLLDRWLVIVNSEKLLETLGSERDDVLSFREAIRELLQVDHTLGSDILDHPYHIDLIRSKLNRNFQHLLPLIRDEAAHAFEVHIESKLNGQGKRL
ncbi:hypothetical protein C0992_005579 [Termitomyces sp. T32_za158]|nr:hypothetical protein C0992_005579 [Termitomyces sp. T32_za158]